MSYSSIQNQIRTINQNLHNCSSMLNYKKLLEIDVNRSNCVKLKKHFQITKYNKRKKWFYQKIIEDILILRLRRTKIQKNIIKLTCKILDLYHEKQNMKNSLKNQLHLIDEEDEERYAVEDEQERIREWFIEENRYEN